MRFPSLSIALGASLLTPALTQTTLKMMPLGDSITEFGCWRAYLWDKLSAAGIKGIDWVGSVTDSKTCSGVSTWDRNHEGHAGYLAIDIANKYLVNWLDKAKPDIVFFHLGTNDVSGHSTAEIITAYGKMVDEMRASKATMKIIVSQIIPFPAQSAKVNSLDAAIPAWVKSKSTPESPITMVDCNTGWSGSDLKDGVHPNEAGDRKMVTCLYPEVLRVIKAYQNGTAKVGRSWGA